MKVLSTTIGLFLSVNANGVFGSDSSNIHGSAGLNTEQETQQASVIPKPFCFILPKANNGYSSHTYLSTLSLLVFCEVHEGDEEYEA